MAKIFLYRHDLSSFAKISRNDRALQLQTIALRADNGAEER